MSDLDNRKWALQEGRDCFVNGFTVAEVLEIVEDIGLSPEEVRLEGGMLYVPRSEPVTIGIAIARAQVAQASRRGDRRAARKDAGER